MMTSLPKILESGERANYTTYRILPELIEDHEARVESSSCASSTKGLFTRRQG